jgi:hypothetical protein
MSLGLDGLCVAVQPTTDAQIPSGFPPGMGARASG